MNIAPNLATPNAAGSCIADKRWREAAVIRNALLLSQFQHLLHLSSTRMSLLDQVKKTAFEGFKTVATAMQAPPTVSCFKQKGFLTPEEFVQAGDVLVHSCRTWQWEAGDAATALP